MKIIFIANGLIYSDNYPSPKLGGSVQTWGVAKELAKRGHEVCIIRRHTIDRTNIDGVNLVGIDFKGIDTKIRPRTYLFYMFALFSQIYFSGKSLKIIENYKPDIICLIDRISGIFPSYLHIPKVYIMHVTEELDFYKSFSIHADKLNSVMFNVKKFITNKILSNVDGIVVLNSFIEGYLSKRYENVYKIPNGIDIENFSNNGDESFILYAGRFDWNKNVCSLVNVFAQIHKSYSSYRLYLVGAGPEGKKIENLVNERGIQSHVKIIPWLPRNKLTELMSRCSVFVLPSFFEVSPVVVLEAMASAKPVIARANMGTVDIIIHGENGYLYNNNEELREYLEKLLSDDNLREKIGRNARRVVEREYAFSKIADKYEELFYTLIKKL
jgi:glycosyltransferase involved in cell wall biosynthesis